MSRAQLCLIIFLLRMQMVRSLAVSTRLKAQRVIQEDLTLATLAGTLFRTAINVSIRGQPHFILV